MAPSVSWPLVSASSIMERIAARSSGGNRIRAGGTRIRRESNRGVAPEAGLGRGPVGSFGRAHGDDVGERARLEPERVVDPTRRLVLLGQVQELRLAPGPNPGDEHADE